jgi:hypothetical protein
MAATSAAFRGRLSGCVEPAFAAPAFIDCSTLATRLFAAGRSEAGFAFRFVVGMARLVAHPPSPPEGGYSTGAVAIASARQRLGAGSVTGPGRMRGQHAPATQPSGAS